MRFTIISILACATYVTAQTSACAAQYIVDTCVSSTTAILSACTANDWDCMCTSQKAVLQCYDNCPNNPDRVTANSQLTAWCNARDVVASQSAAVSSIRASASSTITSAATTTTPSVSTSTTGSTASARSTGIAGAMMASVGGPFGVAAVAGIAGILL